MFLALAAATAVLLSNSFGGIGINASFGVEAFGIGGIVWRLETLPRTALIMDPAAASRRGRTSMFLSGEDEFDSSEDSRSDDVGAEVETTRQQPKNSPLGMFDVVDVGDTGGVDSNDENTIPSFEVKDVAIAAASFVAVILFWTAVPYLRYRASMFDFDVETYLALKGVMAPTSGMELGMGSDLYGDGIKELPPLSPPEQLVGMFFGPPTSK